MTTGKHINTVVHSLCETLTDVVDTKYAQELAYIILTIDIV